MDGHAKVKHYCTVCSNYRGKIVEDRVVSLHRFPAREELRKAWIRRIKHVQKEYRFNATQRLCSEHFKDGKFERDTIPSVFGKKEFNACKLTGETGETEDVGKHILEPAMDTESSTADYFGQDSSLIVDNYVAASMSMHDYCGCMLNSCDTLKMNKSEQTDIVSVMDMSTQTQPVGNSQQDICTQTDISTGVNDVRRPIMKDVGIQCDKPVLTFEDAANSDKFSFYTGVPNVKVFTALFDEMSDSFENTARSGTTNTRGRPRSLRLVDEFFMVLMRLRLGLLLEDLADRFCISKSTCGAIFDRWIDYLSVKLSFLTTWPSRTVIRKTMPAKFKRYSDTRVIIDCTEVFTETPQSLGNRSLLYSHYKSHMTYKALVGISPAGVITFVTDLWCGSISDKQLTKQSDILNLCEPGDAIMADKGFLISDLTTPRGLKLIIPPFKRAHRKFFRREIEETRRIANLRIYVEMAMKRIKNFRVLQGVIPITLSHKVSKIWKICVHLSNLQPPLVPLRS